ncbi:MAG: hypothetical protein K2F63_05180, partial [Muribaculaceae bacterium]|nr:hypothetical protein [Muribaculaceae bacterium]
SIWAPITAHVLNNTIFVVSAWIELRRNPEALISDSVVEFPAYAWLVSGVVTAAALYVLHRYCRRTGTGELS